MNKNIKYAIGWGAVGMVYMAIGAMNFWLRQPVFGAIILVVGYLWSAWMIFKHGGLYGINFAWDRVDKRLEEIDAMLDEAIKATGRKTGPVWDLCDKEPQRNNRRDRAQRDFWRQGKGGAQLRCRRCGYTEFSRVAGRYVCACCGEVMESHGEEGSTVR